MKQLLQKRFSGSSDFRFIRDRLFLLSISKFFSFFFVPLWELWFCGHNVFVMIIVHRDTWCIQSKSAYKRNGAPSTEAISSGRVTWSSMTLTRYSDSQNGRSLVHPLLPQPSPNCSDEKSESVKHSPSHCFVVCADTQIGMTSGNKEWETELAYSREAIKMINNLNPRPLFCCMCGDLVGKAKLASCAMLWIICSHLMDF